MSSDESINEWSLSEIDLDKPLVDLHSVIDNRKTLNDALFEYINEKELNKIFSSLKSNEKKDDLDIERIKQLCLIQLERLPKQKIIKLIDLELDGKKADINLSEDEKIIEEEKKIEEKKKEELLDDIQINVDDKEYEEFLNSECFNEINDNKSDSKLDNKSIKNLSQNDQQNLIIHQLAFPPIAEDENLDNCKKSSEQDERGWQNLYNQTQLEIQELEMRANAIKAMMEKSKITIDKNENKKEEQYLDNIDSEDDYLSEEDEELNKDNRKSNEKEDKKSIDKEIKKLNDKEERNESDEEREIRDVIEKEYLEINSEKQKLIKKSNEKRRLESRLSVESGEILEDDDSEIDEKIVQKRPTNKHYHYHKKRNRSPSITSSIDSFGRNRRRSRSSRRSNSSFSSLDEILREAESEEEKINLDNEFELKSNSNKHRHHHHKRQRTPK